VSHSLSLTLNLALSSIAIVSYATNCGIIHENSRGVNYDSIVKNMFGFSILFIYSFQCYWQVLQTSNDLRRQFSAPFKAGNSRQVKTCYKPQNTTQRNLQHYLVHTSSRETGVLMTLNHRASMLQRRSLLTHVVIFSLPQLKRLHFCRSCVKQCRYHNCIIFIIQETTKVNKALQNLM
jgi:hypothetical protein